MSEKLVNISTVSSNIKCNLALSALKGSVDRLQSITDLWELYRNDNLDYEFETIYHHILDETIKNTKKVADITLKYLSNKK